MTTNKILLGGLAGAVTLFLLKWIVYGVLLIDYITANYNPCVLRPMQDYIIWAMILATFAFGFLISMIFSWSNTTGIVKGAKVAGIIGLLYSVSIDLSLYGTSTRFSNLTAVFVSIIVGTVLWVIAGAVVGWVMGMEKKKA
ncbi:MAG: hypothetical protein NTZ69_09340 [Bacteroidia bacterium]|nr:hypothetical protein [Bacteroidia bacterium]